MLFLALLPLCQAVLKTYGHIESNGSTIVHNLNSLSNKIVFEGDLDVRNLRRPSLSFEVLPGSDNKNYKLQVRHHEGVIFTGLKIKKNQNYTKIHQGNETVIEAKPESFHTFKVAAAFPKTYTTGAQHSDMHLHLQHINPSNFYFRQRTLMADFDGDFDFIFFTICLKSTSPYTNPNIISTQYSSNDVMRMISEKEDIRDSLNMLADAWQAKISREADAFLQSIFADIRERQAPQQVAQQNPEQNVIEQDIIEEEPESPYGTDCDTLSEDEEMIQ